MMKYIIFLIMISSMSIHAQNQALSQLVFEIRNPQTDAEHFRSALEKIGEYLALQVMEELDTEEQSIRTLTGVDAKHDLIKETPVLVTILRAGLPLNAGAHKVFPNAEVGFLAMSRDEETLKAKTDYIAIPKLENRVVIITDTMLATGGSMFDAIQIIEQYKPKQIFVITAIAAVPGIERITQYNPSIKVFAGVVDPKLNDKGYILPGLGDAGDRAYGHKHFLN